MIRVIFQHSKFDAWASEMGINYEWVTVLRKHGIPAIGRLAFSGVEQGELTSTHDGKEHVFTWRDAGEHPDSGRNFRDVFSGLLGGAYRTGYRVALSGRHLVNHEKDEEL